MAMRSEPTCNKRTTLDSIEDGRLPELDALKSHTLGLASTI